MPLYYTDKSLEEVEKVRMIPNRKTPSGVSAGGKTAVRSMGNEVNNYNNHFRAQAGAKGYTDISSDEFTRRQTVNATRDIRGLKPKYEMHPTVGQGTKAPKKTIGAHRGDVPAGQSTSGRGAKGDKPKKQQTTKPKKQQTTKPKKKKVKKEKLTNRRFGTGRRVIGRGKGEERGGEVSVVADNPKEEDILNYVSPHTQKLTRRRYVDRSLYELQGFINGMLEVMKINRSPSKNSRRSSSVGEHDDTKVQGGNTQFEGTAIMERNRGRGTIIRDPTGNPRERKARKGFKFQTTVGGASTLKTYSFNSLDTSLDTLKSIHLTKDTYSDDKFNKEQGKGKRIKITTDTRRGAHGGDTSRKPKAIGLSTEEQKIIQS